MTRRTQYRTESIAVKGGLVRTLVLGLIVGAMVATAGAQTYTYSTIYTFLGYNSADGANPGAGLTLGSDGYLYGTTVYGGTDGYGTVFKLNPSNQAETVLYSFTDGSDGASPVNRLAFGPNGELYGTTAAGETDDCMGTGGCGTVFSLYHPSLSTNWTFSSVYSFSTVVDGSDPYGEIAFDSSGNLYGTTRYGGSGGGITSGGQANCTANSAGATPYGCGTVFEMQYNAPPAGPGGPTIVWNFDDSSNPPSCGSTLDGIEPAGGVVLDGNGNLLGTTIIGGDSSSSFGYGTAFQLTLSGSSWSEKILENLDDGYAGGYSFATLYSQSSSGPFYGTAADAGGTESNGTPNDGTAFDLTSGSPTCGNWVWTRIQTFPVLGYPNSPTGAKLDLLGPRGSLVMYNGNLYGTQATGGDYNLGAVFEIPYSSGSWQTPVTLYSFPGGSEGAYPQGGLAVDSNGNLYGTAYTGGQPSCAINNGNTNNSGCGVIFKLTLQ